MAEAEVSLINKVELRIALAKTDEKLSQLLNVYLPPLLLKLNSPHSAVRAKVVEVCQHVNQRVRSGTTIFPVEALLAQFRNPDIIGDKNMMQTFDLMYIQKGLDGLSPDLKNILVPNVIESISGASNAHASTLFRIFLRLLTSWKPAERGTIDADNLRSTYGFDKNPQDAQFLSTKIMNLFLLDLSVFHDAEADDNLSCPGLNSDEFSFLTKNDPKSFAGSELFQAKQNSLKFILSGGFEDRELFFPLLMACHDSRTEIFHVAEDAFKRLKVDKEEKALVELLYDFAIGIKRQVVGPAILTHILQLCSKSKLAANLEPYRLIEKGLQSEYRRATQATIQFIRWVSKEASTEVLGNFAPKLITDINSWIMEIGWPKMTTRDTQLGSLRANAYEATGAIMRRSPEVIKDLHYIKFLFESLENDTSDMKPSIQEALSDVLPALDVLDESSKQSLREMLLTYFYASNADQSCKYVAVRYAVRSAQYSDPLARLICILALSRENRPDVIEEAKRGLHPYWFKLVNTHYNDLLNPNAQIAFPKFSELLAVIAAVQSKLPAGQGSNSLYGLPYSVFTIAMTYLEQVLVMEAVEGKKSVVLIDDQWETHVENALSVDDKVRQMVMSHLVSMDYESLDTFFKLLFSAVKESHVDLMSVGKIWLRLLSLSPPQVVEKQTHRIGELVKLLNVNKFTFLQTVSNTLGIMGTANGVDSSELLATLTSEGSGPGQLLSTAYILSRLNVRNNLGAVSSASLSGFLKNAAKMFAETHESLVVDVGIEAVTQLALFGAGDKDFVKTVKPSLLTLLKKDNDRAFFAFGSLSLIDQENCRTYLDTIYENITSKYPDVMFASGEALTVVAAGWKSKVTSRYLDIQDLSSPNFPALKESLLDEVILSVMAKCKSPKPSLRKFACIWLLSIAQYCGHLPEAKPHLENIHLSFMRFLADRDEVTQEAASRGLSIIYELGNNDLKERLIKGLVKSFTSESNYGLNSGVVSEDTQLFEPGVLNTGDGSVSTYKDILSLASEVGDASLVYKFMSLAANSSLWASRKGAAFGLGSLLSKANFDEVFQSNEKLSQTLIPKLYRYRFDPNQGVQHTMRGIWDTLVKDKSKTIEKNFFNILDELLKGMGDREWRVREASSSALSDLLQTRRLEDYQQYLERIWKMSFRTVDDVKDSVRVAGMQLTRGLATSLVRHVDVESGTSEKVAEEILKELIPFLIGNSGLQSDSEDVQKFALDTLLKLCKKGGQTLRPYIPALVEELLDLLSTLEPQAMNYLALNADKYGLTGEAIDASRMASLRSSPMMEAVEQMVDQADRELLADLVPRLSKVIRKSVGLPSKLGASRVVVTLIVRNTFQMNGYADTLLTACRSQLIDRNETVAQSYAVSNGYLCRAASQESILAYSKFLQKTYFESQTDRNRAVSGLGVLSISNHASDKFSGLEAEFLPFAFVAKHDSDKSVSDLFERVWSDNTGGTGAVKLYLKEILQLVNEHLSSRLWNIRQVVAKGVAEASKSFGEESLTNSEVLVPLYDVLFQACVGKSWNGKEQVLQALVELSVRTKDFLSAHTEMQDKLDSVLTTEVRRKNKDYQIEAIGSFGQYVSKFATPELFGILFEVADIYLSSEDDSSSDEDDGEDVKMKNTGSLSNNIAKEEARNKVLNGAVSAFTLEDRNGSSVADDVLAKLAVFLKGIFSSDSVPITWRSKLLFLKSISNLASKYSSSDMEIELGVASSGTFYDLWKTTISFCSKDLNHEKVRVESARLGGALIYVLDQESSAAVSKDLRDLIEWEKSPVVTTEIRSALK